MKHYIETDISTSVVGTSIYAGKSDTLDVSYVTRNMIEISILFF